MIKGCIFDLDGLLINSEVVSYQLYQDLLRPYWYSFSIEDYTKNYSGKTAKGNMEAIIERFSLPISISQDLEIVDKNEKIYIQKGISLKACTLELLKLLKENNIKKILATSSTKDRALTILEKHGLENEFDAYVYGTEVKNGKPNPDIFLKAYEKSGLDKEELVVFEDSEAGIESAYRAGIKVINIPDMKVPSGKFQNMAYYTMNSLKEATTLFKKKLKNGEEL